MVGDAYVVINGTTMLDNQAEGTVSVAPRPVLSG
jgi:hypothetical protein